MKEIKDILKELDNTILIHPNELTYGVVSELPHYHFVDGKVKTLKSPLWHQALQNVAAKLFDLDIFDINANPNDLYHLLRDFDYDDLKVFSKYYLNLDLGSFLFEENSEGHFIANNNERINTDTICKILSNCISYNLEAVTNFIIAQLISVQDEEWILLYELDDDDTQKEELLSALKHFI